MSLIEFFKKKPGYLKKSSYIVQDRLNNRYSIAEINSAKTYINQLRRENAKLKQPSRLKFQEAGMYVAIGCIHAPFHNKKMMESFLSFVGDYKNDIKGLVIAGDFLDMNALSFYDRGQVGMNITLGDEYKEGTKILDKIDSIIPHTHKAFIYGNHENRYIKYLKNVDNNKLGNALISPEDGLKLKQRGYSVKTDWVNDFVTIGDHLQVYHGEFYNIHPAKKALDTYKSSVVFFHTHRINSHVESNMGAFNGGFMGDADSKVFSYASKAQRKSWINGFIVVHVDEEGFYNIQQVIWNNNKFYFGHKSY